MFVCTAVARVVVVSPGGQNIRCRYLVLVGSARQPVGAFGESIVSPSPKSDYSLHAPVLCNGWGGGEPERQQFVKLHWHLMTHW